MSFVQPPILRGTDAQQLVQIRNYLYQLSRDLNHTLSNLSGENFSAASTARSILAGEMSEEQKKELLDGLGNLKSLIIKTAHTVHAEMDTLEQTLSSSYVAISDYGTFKEDIIGQLKATAGTLEQSIAYYAELHDQLGGVYDQFDAYQIEVEGYIRQGIIGYDGAIPIIGIAIGRDLKVTGGKVTVDGKDYDVIDTSSNMSIWTPDKLSFYVNGAEIAYFSNGALYVGTVIVNTKLVVGQRKWQIDHSNGFALKWIGG